MKRKRHYVDRNGRLVYLSDAAAREYRVDALELGIGKLVGPFKTKGCAQFFLDQSPTNHHIKCVADAERIYKRSKELMTSLAHE